MSLCHWIKQLLLSLYVLGGSILSLVLIGFSIHGYNLGEAVTPAAITGLFLIPHIILLPPYIFRQKCIRESSLFIYTYELMNEHEFKTWAVLTTSSLLYIAAFTMVSQSIGVLTRVIIFKKTIHSDIQTFGIGLGITSSIFLILYLIILIMILLCKCRKQNEENNYFIFSSEMTRV